MKDEKEIMSPDPGVVVHREPFEPRSVHRQAERILILAPRLRNAEVLDRILNNADLVCNVCTDTEMLVAEADEGVGVLLLTMESLTAADMTSLQQMLDRQPPWSRLPIVLLVERGPAEATALEWMRRSNGHASVTLLEHPVRAFTLVSTVEAALEARRQQYQVRDLHATLEARVEAGTAQVRTLALQLTAAEQRERKRIARILHDHLQQELYGVQFLVQTLQSRSGEVHQELLSQIQETLLGAVQSTRTLSVDLAPPVLEREGLTAALLWLAEQMETRHGLQVIFTAQGDDCLLSRTQREFLFDSVRELLFNTVKHAGVDVAQLTLRCHPQQVTVVVKDRGSGIPDDILRAFAQSANSLGLHSVHNRMELAGGQMVIQSSPGEGTTISLVLPLSPGDR